VQRPARKEEGFASRARSSSICVCIPNCGQPAGRGVPVVDIVELAVGPDSGERPAVLLRPIDDRDRNAGALLAYIRPLKSRDWYRHPIVLEMATTHY
jgi:hypothetical protein